jgi:hypothetical protein
MNESMKELAQAVIKLLSFFDKKPLKTSIFVVILAVIGGIFYYMYLHQPKSVPEGSQIIQSTGDDNKNSNSK